MSESINRVHYYKGQFLRTSDFQDEQEYHNKMRYRHNIAHHQWGIVTGLEVVIDAGDGLPYLQPGMAVDGYGRELLVTETRPLPVNRFDLESSETLDVWLYFLETSGSQNRGGSNGCDDDSANAFDRWQENPQLWLEDPLDEPVDRRKPPLVDPAFFDFGPHMSPASADLVWPVFLAQISRDQSQSPPVYSCNLDNRPYIGAVAAALESPSDKTRIQLGSTGKDDPQRFTVTLPGEEDNPYLKLTSETDSESGLVHNKWRLRGQTTIDDTLTIDNGALQFEAGTACPQEALPWSIYQCKGEENFDGVPQDVKALRLELPSAGTGNNRISIGAWSADEGENGGFKSILTIADNQQITVNGSLHVNGKATVADSGFSDDALDQIKSAFAGSLARVGLLGVLNPGLNIVGAPAMGLAGTPANIAQFANNLAAASKVNLHSANLIYSLFEELAHPFFKTLTLGSPLAAAEITLTQPFNDPTEYGNFLHEGVDYSAEDACGGPHPNKFYHDINECQVDVLCMVDGQIELVNESDGYGTHVIVRSEHMGIPFTIWYCHLAGSAAQVQEAILGEVDYETGIIRAGKVIGKMGSTGNSTAPHVHINLVVESLVPAGDYVVHHVVNPHPFVIRGNTGQFQVTYT